LSILIVWHPTGSEEKDEVEAGIDDEGTAEARSPLEDKPPELGPDSIQILEGSTFAVSDVVGDMPEGVVAGFFHRDTRHVSKWQLTIGGRTPSVLTSGTVDYYSASFALTNPELPGIPAQSLSIQRFRLVGDGMRESLHVENHLSRPVQVELKLACGADFADLFEVKDRIGHKEGEYSTAHIAGRTELAFGYRNGPFGAGTWIRATQQGRIDGDALVWDLHLEPRGSWTTGVRVAVRQEDAAREPSHGEFVASARLADLVLEKWRVDVPGIESSMDLVQHIYRKSIVDLAGLRLTAELGGYETSLPAAGLPWFMAIFGRDTLITSYQSLWVGPDLAKGALYALSALQGREVNEFRDEEPGKFLHEIRYGELTVLGRRPHSPYYGTADATPLWLILLSEYWRFTGDGATCADLKWSALAALEWIDRYGDRDGDGYVEYDTRSSQGLENQGWRDSWDGVLSSDGSVPKRPLALCEIQGYVYDAKLRIAEIAENVWDDADLSARLRREADTLRERFNRDFWTDDRDGFYVLALDEGKQHVDSKTSNMGHLLWSGIVPEDRAERVVRQLFAESMFTGWGIRTLSTENAGYNPIGYHRGTVWPHDNSIVSAGLVRYGYRDEANRLAMAMFEAASFVEYRLPEVFAGYPRSHGRFPVRYPTACCPQAWATAAPFLWLRLILGLDARDGKVTCDPHVPEEIPRLALRGIHAFGSRWDVVAEGTTSDLSKAD
jgi:glycogen debranching enzyme